jgi:hypothetical protein
VHKTIKKLLVCIDKGIQFLGNGKYGMEICPIDNLGFAGIYPDFLEDGLAVGAVTVAT